jgi:hypothetical protein
LRISLQTRLGFAIFVQNHIHCATQCSIHSDPVSEKIFSVRQLPSKD